MAPCDADIDMSKAIVAVAAAPGIVNDHIIIVGTEGSSVQEAAANLLDRFTKVPSQ